MQLEKCVEYMKEKHKEQKRKQGTPYYEHPLAVSKMLKEKGFPIYYQIVGLFHDLLEDTDTTYEEIKAMTNKEIADAVKFLSKEQGYVMEEYIKGIKSNDMAKMVKLADRIHNLVESKFGSLEFQKRYIEETEEWFIDLGKGTIFETDLEKALMKEKEEVKKIQII